jgi:[acyl-carrier-protein] S-malonyltransferase
VSGTPRVAAVFPGQGSQAVGMGRAFYGASPAARAVLDRAEAALPGLLDLMFEGPAETLTLTANQQPALVAAGAAAYAAWREAGGPEPVVAAGHSLGEYTAHVAAGTLSVEDAVRLVRGRGSYMQEAVAPGEGAMAAILKLPDEVVEALCAEARSAGGVVEVANLNAPGQVVVSGRAGPVAAVAEAAKARGGRSVPLKVSAPFHCSLMRPAAERLAGDLAGVRFAPGAFPVICNVDAAPLASPADAPALLEAQVTAPVRWTDTVRAIDALGVDRWVELGAGKVLTGLIGRTLDAADARPAADPDQLAAALSGGPEEDA